MNSTVFVYTLNQVGQPGKWSRFIFPFPIDDFTQLNDKLYIRSGDDILHYDLDSLTDFTGDARQAPFPGVVWWNYLDMGQPGTLKSLIGFDVVTSGDGPYVSIGFDQADMTAYTTPFQVPADTMPGMLIPLPITCPSMSLKLAFDGGAKWRVLAANLYLQDLRPTS